MQTEGLVETDKRQRCEGYPSTANAYSNINTANTPRSVQFDYRRVWGLPTGPPRLTHCRTRPCIKMTICMLKSWFQCLHKLRVTPERACNIIVVCVDLHNIATIRGDQHPAVQINDPVDDLPIHPADVQDGRAARDLQELLFQLRLHHYHHNHHHRSNKDT